MWRGTGGRCSGDEGDGDKRVSMLSVGFRDWDCVSERISWLINDWSLLDLRDYLLVVLILMRRPDSNFTPNRLISMFFRNRVK